MNLKKLGDLINEVELKLKIIENLRVLGSFSNYFDVGYKKHPVNIIIKEKVTKFLADAGYKGYDYFDWEKAHVLNIHLEVRRKVYKYLYNKLPYEIKVESGAFFLVDPEEMFHFYVKRYGKEFDSLIKNLRRSFSTKIYNLQELMEKSNELLEIKNAYDKSCHDVRSLSCWLRELPSGYSDNLSLLVKEIRDEKMKIVIDILKTVGEIDDNL